MNLQKSLQILNLPDSPTPEAVKKAYRVLALRYHPDRNSQNPQAADLFREATEAYAFLVENIDKWRSRKAPKGKVKPRSVVEDFEDIFDDIFGFTREDRILGYQDPQNLEVTLFDLAYGGLKKVKLVAYEKCVFCKGNGSEKNTPVLICNYCFGAGIIKAGPVGEEASKLCPRCTGRGRRMAKPCLICKGFGRVGRALLQEVKLPRGLVVGQEYTIHSTAPGASRTYDLFVKPKLKKSPVFQVENSDVVCDYPVGLTLAKKGGALKFMWLWGQVAVKIPAGSKNGDQIHVAGQGLMTGPSSKAHGTLHLRLVCLPEKEAEARARLMSLMISKRGADSPGFWDRLRSLFDL